MRIHDRTDFMERTARRTEDSMACGDAVGIGKYAGRGYGGWG